MKNNFYGQNDEWLLGLMGAEAEQQESGASNRAELPPPLPGLLLVGLGTSGCGVVQTCVRDAARRGIGMRAVYIDYPQPPMRDIPLQRTEGAACVPAEPFCSVGDVGDRRDRARQFPLLAERYRTVLRGTPVWEDRRLQVAGEGGGAIGGVTALDVDLSYERIRAFLNTQLQPLVGIAGDEGAGSDFVRIAGGEARRERAARRATQIVFVFGASGATGNALSQLTPYFVRDLLREREFTRARLIGLALGPQAYKGFTPYTAWNYHALLRSLEHMTRHGQHREYIGHRIDVDAPPYDELLLFDDATLKTDERGRATEDALTGFHARAARLLRVLLSSDVLERVGAHDINHHGRRSGDGRTNAMRWLKTVNISSALVERDVLHAHASLEVQARLLAALAERFTDEPDDPGKEARDAGAVFGAATAAAEETTQDELFAGRQLLAAAECGAMLPTLLLQQADGSPYRPVQLTTPTRNAPAAALMQLTQWLMRPDSAGGHDPVVSANKADAVARATRVLLDRLAAPGTEVGYRQLLQQTRDAAQEQASQFEAAAREDRERVRKAEERKRRYQASQGGGLRKLFGGLVSLSEAVQAFNTVELLEARSAAGNAAADVMNQTAALCERILAGVDDVRATAEAGARAAQIEAQRLLRTWNDGAPAADYVVSPEAITRWIVERMPLQSLMSELIGVARNTGGEGLSDAAHAIAEREIETHLRGQDLLTLVQVEASATPVDGSALPAAEGAMRIASHLVKLVRQIRPGLRCVPGAQNARVFQVTAGSALFFRHPELAAAHFHASDDELAFVRIESDLALSDLTLINDGAQDFERARRDREFFVLEELAQQSVAGQSEERGAADVAPDMDAWSYLRNELRTTRNGTHNE